MKQPKKHTQKERIKELYKLLYILHQRIEKLENVDKKDK